MVSIVWYDYAYILRLMNPTRTRERGVARDTQFLWVYLCNFGTQFRSRDNLACHSHHVTLGNRRNLAPPKMEQFLPQLAIDPAALPVGQLESMRFKANQLVDSIQNLHNSLAFGLQTPAGINPNMLPPWPDILAKYSLLVSQTHTLSQSLTATLAQPAPV